MNKIESVMKLYKTVFPDVKLEKAGTWIRVYPTDGSGDSYQSFYSDELLTEIFQVTGNMYEWDAELKSLHVVAAHADTLWDTGDNWNTKEDNWDTYNPYGEHPYGKPEEEENIFEDIGEV